MDGPGREVFRRNSRPAFLDVSQPLRPVGLVSSLVHVPAKIWVVQVCVVNRGPFEGGGGIRVLRASEGMGIRMCRG